MHHNEKIPERPLIIVLSDDYRFSAGLQMSLSKKGFSPLGFYETESAIQYENTHKQLKKLFVLDAAARNSNWLDILDYFHARGMSNNCIALLSEDSNMHNNAMLRSLRGVFPKNDTVRALLPDFIAKTIEIMETEGRMSPSENHYDALPDQEPVIDDPVIDDPQEKEKDFLYDVMKEKEKHSEKQNEAARSAFLASLSNELLNPLSIISKSIELLKQTQLDIQQSQNLETIYDSTESLHRIVNSLLSAVGGYFAGENRLGSHIDAILNNVTDYSAEHFTTDHELEYLTNKRKDLRILFAEDDAINQLYLAAFLRSQGWMVDTAYNGKDAFEMFDAGKYDLIILDGQMPGMDGFETAKKIRDLENADTRIPILAISGYAIPGEKEKFINSGMDEYLPKPINESSLLRLICQLTA
jgi:CheY-like chemotaxis protein